MCTLRLWSCTLTGVCLSCHLCTWQIHISTPFLPTIPQWRAKERAAQLAEARQLKHEQRLATFKQRGLWAAEAAAK